MLNDKMETNLRKLEDMITSTKKAKFNHDTTDYLKNEVYNWEQS